jgi:type I restriction enzyme R subunit
VYEYPYERAVREGYLVDYDLVTVESGVRMQGIFLKEGEAVDVVDPETGEKTLDILEDEREYPSEQIERSITSVDSNRKILEEIKRYADEHEERYGRFPKILIFAVQDIPHISHADQLVNTAREVFGQGDAFVQKITGKVDRPCRGSGSSGTGNCRQSLSVLISSQPAWISPTSSTSSSSAGEVRILFEQMMGRGTRKGEHYRTSRTLPSLTASAGR